MDVDQEKLATALEQLNEAYVALENLLGVTSELDDLELAIQAIEEAYQQG